MKKTLALLFTLLFVAALFAGCGGSAGDADDVGGADDVGSAGDAGDAGGTGEPVPTAGEDDGDNLAPGKYAADENGWPVEKYEYELPLTTRNVTLSFFTLCWTPQYLPDGLMANVPMWVDMQKMTGVNLEFIQVTGENCNEQFAVLLAADDVPDITSEGQYRYTGTQQESIEEGVFANLYDYREYMPNYMWEVLERSKTNQNTYDTVFITEDQIVSFYTFSTTEATTGWVLRQDMMNELSLGDSSEVNTFDKLHSVLTAFKTAYGGGGFYPMAMYNTLELDAGKMLSGFNTAIIMNQYAFPTRLKDGEVQIIGVQDDDRDAIALLAQWTSEGLITPNYMSYANNQDMSAELAQGNMGYVYMVPTDATDFAATCVDPDCLYQPCARIRKTEDQVIHYGLQGMAVGYGTYVVGAACEEIPIAVSWCDWQYSNSGSEFITYGPEGCLWERNENGERVMTDFALNSPAGYGWIMMAYAHCSLMDGGLAGYGDKPVNVDTSWSDHFQEVWQEAEHDNAWDWLTGIKLTTEETDEINNLTADCMTYQTENISLFIDGSKPMSDWDDYCAELEAMGLGRMLEIYNDAYARYLESKA